MLTIATATVEQAKVRNTEISRVVVREAPQICVAKTSRDVAVFISVFVEPLECPVR